MFVIRENQLESVDVKSEIGCCLKVLQNLQKKKHDYYDYCILAESTPHVLKRLVDS